ncbi:hypothetical protein [Paracoccus onubensis]|uniref:hypothetical protein n=1 Tax=Paracoccus onubensis TaxID=1675788 RepID=UPI001E4AFB14|nr:hypothetical protein [Paracoccus onubensis]
MAALPVTGFSAAVFRVEATALRGRAVFAAGFAAGFTVDFIVEAGFTGFAAVRRAVDAPTFFASPEETVSGFSELTRLATVNLLLLLARLAITHFSP